LPITTSERIPENVLDQFGREARIAPETLVKRFKEELATIKGDVERLNAGPSNWGLGGLLNGVFAGGPGQGNTLSQPFTIANSQAYTPVTLNRILLSYAYMSHGLVQTLVKQPVDDAFRGGVKIKSAELDADELKDLERAMKKTQSAQALRKMARTVGGWVNYNACADLSRSDMSAIKHALCWGRLYGGGGLIVNTDQDFRKELDPERIRKDSPLVFIPADRWELVLSNINIFDYKTPMPYDYYGYPIHTTRVFKFLWNEAPSYIRLRLQGWGMSEIERCVRTINAYLKFENLIFELLDEAKIDVWRMKGYNSLLISEAGTQRVRQAVEMTNQLKNFNNAIVMDKEDEYTQKQLGSIFTGLSDAWEQLRLNLCSDLKFPRNKLFGESAGGFSSGEDSLENYNAIVESLRETADPLVIDCAALRCQQLFGFIPDDLETEWPSLRVMKATDTEIVNTSKQDRVQELYDRGLYDAKEASEALRADNLLPIDTAALKGKKVISPDAQQQQFALAAEKHQGKSRVLGDDNKKKKKAA
jgi:phage-related protein (TIGR01555 family)